MKPIFPTSAAAMALAIAGMIPVGHAQVPVLQQASPADELAGEMRVLAANPTDVQAMVRAGELTLKLDDPSAASGFFARAERIDPNNPRIKAGKGIIQLRAGRPGDALRRFAEAEQVRGDLRTFAAERGLAYDLIGEQERAQRDYRLALKSGPLNAVGLDETMRRYALSLGISGKRDEALAQLDPLLRRSDRGAWRARAFILAMNGDGRGAERIAASMMPGGLGQALQPFFDKLPTLGPADRAFAVHFGEVRTTPQRQLDARLAPAMAALPPDPDKPVAVAAIAPRAVDVETRTSKRDKKRNKHDKVQLAIAAPLTQPLPPPPAYQPPVVAMVQPLPSQQPSYSPVARASTPIPVPSVALASNRDSLPKALPVPRREAVPTNRAAAEVDMRLSAVPERSLAPRTGLPLGSGRVDALSSATSKPVRQEDISGPYEAIKPAVVAKAAPTRVQPIPTPSLAPIAMLPPAVVVGVKPEVQPQFATPVAAAATPLPAQQTILAQAVPSKPLPPVPGPMKGEDSILAAIIANITVPGTELDVGARAPDAAPVATPELSKLAQVAPVRPVTIPVRVEPDPAALEAKAASEKALNDKKLIEKEAVDKQAAEKKAGEKKAADKKAADKKIADKKLADKKAADAKKLADAKKAAEELKRKNDPKILEPSRIWVQVAGGANEHDLPKEWAKVREKAPAAFKGKSGWMTPLRATNRVLAGPFKTDAEARSFVNTLAKEGLSGFTFTSEAGQKVTRLSGK
jgi:tetratricopeptide (TPR) repeat protein